MPDASGLNWGIAALALLVPCAIAAAFAIHDYASRNAADDPLGDMADWDDEGDGQ